MRIIELLPHLKGISQLVCCGEDYMTFESDVLTLPDTTYFGWRLFIDEFDAGRVVAEHSFCKNTEKWGWHDEATSCVPISIREILQADLSRFIEFLSKRLGVDVSQWETISITKILAE